MGNTISVRSQEVLNTCVGGKERIHRSSISIGVITGMFEPRHLLKDDFMLLMSFPRSLTHLPLTSLFYPILSIPTTVHRIFTPTLHFLGRYRDSFTDGSQLKALETFRAEVERGGAKEVLGKVRDHWEKQSKKGREMLEKQREMEKSQNDVVESERLEKNDGSSGWRRTYQAKERDREDQQREVEREGVKKVGKEVEGKGE